MKKYISSNIFIPFSVSHLVQGNKVHTTLYDGNITAFENQLLLSKTYIISNVVVKDTKAEYKALNGDFQ